MIYEYIPPVLVEEFIEGREFKVYNDLPKTAEKVGITYEQLILKVVDIAIKRIKGES